MKLSLVSVPVKAFTANNSSEDVHLNQLHKGCNSRIKYQKVCPEHGELSSEQIVSGYEQAESQYVVIDPEEVDKLRSVADRSVGIEGFVPSDAVDPRYFSGKTWYLLPDGVAGERPYALLHHGMQQKGVVAIAQVVMSGREQLVLLRPLDKLLVMTGLYYEKKVKGVDEFSSEIDDIKFKPEETALTDTLISASKIEDFDLARYKDQYVDKLRRLIQMKVEGQEIVAVPDHEEPRILNLMDALKQSVAAAQARAAGVPVEGEAGGQKKMAPSTGRKKGPRKVEGG